MHYSTIFSVLAASTAMAAPHTRRQADTSVRVVLSDGAGLTGEAGIPAGGTSFSGFSLIPSASGPFTSVNILVGADLPNQDLRCQILDEAGLPIVATRGANVDITFSDGGNGEWAIGAPTTVTRVVCNNNLPKAPSPEDLKLTVTLVDSGSDNILPITVNSGSRQEVALGDRAGIFDSVELTVGSLVVSQDTRCQVIDQSGNPAIVLRGENRDTTFSDGGNGKWTFEGVAGGPFLGITAVICDPDFVKGVAP